MARPWRERIEQPDGSFLVTGEGWLPEFREPEAELWHLVRDRCAELGISLSLVDRLKDTLLEAEDFLDEHGDPASAHWEDDYEDHGHTTDIWGRMRDR